MYDQVGLIAATVKKINKVRIQNANFMDDNITQDEFRIKNIYGRKSFGNSCKAETKPIEVI
ncbi:hypothetical protein [Aquimarina sp. RZ0]|uniref:hypothetical protein n=1 Tax=Aquimarina sp. RZ0 TaxID=2607730 RepID=UPI001CB73CE5|nr:hypothetical protein [Aquimarina sp. RZ0]